MNQKKIVLPLTIPLRILYFVLSYLIICVRIALSNRCKLPIIPTDLFPLEVAGYYRKAVCEDQDRF